MKPIKAALSAMLATGCAVGLAGCISLFPKSEPAQLYRFGMSEAPVADSSARPVTLVKGGLEFNRAAGGDRILTVTGNQAAYIAGSRWVSPASSLFNEALERAFAASPNAPRLIDLGRMSRGAAILRLDVSDFEARYLEGQEAPPTVVVRFRATLVRSSDRGLIADQEFQGSSRAAENRVGAIVPAYDAALKQAFDGLIEWTARNAGN